MKLRSTRGTEERGQGGASRSCKMKVIQEPDEAAVEQRGVQEGTVQDRKVQAGWEGGCGS